MQIQKQIQIEKRENSTILQAAWPPTKYVWQLRKRPSPVSLQSFQASDTKFCCYLKWIKIQELQAGNFLNMPTIPTRICVKNFDDCLNYCKFSAGNQSAENIYWLFSNSTVCCTEHKHYFQMI